MIFSYLVSYQMDLRLTAILLAHVSCFAISFGKEALAFSQGRPIESALQPRDGTACPLGPGAETNEVANVSGPLWPYQIFKSSKVNPPVLQITSNGEALAPGLLFFDPTDFTPINATQDVAPLIMTDAGQLVWNGPTVSATNFHVATYQGEPVLTFWSGFNSAGANIGHVSPSSTSV